LVIYTGFDFLINKRRGNKKKKAKDRAAEVFLIVKYSESQAEMAVSVLKDNFASGIAKLQG